MGCGGGGDDAAHVEAMWGKRGQMPGQFVKPRAAVIDKNDRIYLVDMRAMVQSFTLDGKLIAHWQTPTHVNGRPSGLAMDRDGRLIVVDSHYHRLLVYETNGNFIREFGNDGPLKDRFGYIGDVAVDSKGNIYVAESQQEERITKLSPDGAILAEWGGRGPEPGQFQRIRSLAFDNSDRLFVADACNHRIQVFDTDGRLIRVFGAPGEAPGQLRYPYDLAVAPDGTIVVCEYGNHRIQRFTSEGQSLGTWGSAGRQKGQLWNPWALSIDSRGRILVVDSNNHRIQVVRM